MIKRLLRRGQPVFLKGTLTGHFYYPIPNVTDLRPRQTAPDIPLDCEAQHALYDRFQSSYSREEFWPQPDNDQFNGEDAWLYRCMLQYSNPSTVIEVGAGFSSLILHATSERFLNSRIRAILIGPHPRDFIRDRVIQKRVQDVPLSVFDQLTSGDIPFVDSSHAVKMGSDVNYIVFDVLPRLNPGVRVHFHEVYYPFEYPVHVGSRW